MIISESLLVSGILMCFEYLDGWVDDVCLVVLNVLVV